MKPIAARFARNSLAVIPTATAIAAAAVLFLPFGASAAAAQETHLLVVGGLGGAPEYQARFAEWGAALVEAAERRGVRPENVVWLAEPSAAHPRVGGESRLERVRAEMVALAGRAAPDDVVVIVLFGHGDARRGEARLNLPGPDLTPGELAVMLEALGSRRVAIVNTASASGAFLEPLKAPNRVVVTATRSAAQNEATWFGESFVDAFTGDGADADRDGGVSLLEAFDYARAEVERRYEGGGRLQTEHAVLDDPDELAGRITFAVPAAAAPAAVAGDPELRRLYARRDSLRAELEALRAKRSEMETAAYEAELERVLLETARNGRAIREREGGDPDA